MIYMRAMAVWQALKKEVHKDKPISIVKVAVEPDLLDNVMNENSDGMVANESESHEDKALCM